MWSGCGCRQASSVVRGISVRWSCIGVLFMFDPCLGCRSRSHLCSALLQLFAHCVTALLARFVHRAVAVGWFLRLQGFAALMAHSCVQHCARDVLLHRRCLPGLLPAVASCVRTAGGWGACVGHSVERRQFGTARSTRSSMRRTENPHAITPPKDHPAQNTPPGHPSLPIRW